MHQDSQPLSTHHVGVTNSSPIRIDEVPACRFHNFIILSGVAGSFCDGYTIGVMGAVLPSVASALHMDSMDQGLLGSGTLFGILIGTLIVGRAADTLGRKPLLQMSILWTFIVSLLQIFVTSLAELFLLRLLLGLTLAADYVAGAAYQIEFLPARNRGQRLSNLLVGWCLGFSIAFQVAFIFSYFSQIGWRLSLAFSAIPAISAYLIRRRLPESIVWLVAHSRLVEARDIARIYLSDYNILIENPDPGSGDCSVLHGKSQLRRLLKHLIVAFVFMVSHIIPYFCVGTFLIEILKRTGIEDAYLVGVVYTVFLVAGAILGKFLIDRVSRKTFFTVTIFIPSILLFILSSGVNFPLPLQVSLFSIFALTLSASSCGEYVYLAELFPLHVRTSCNGFVQFGTRFFVAISTLCFPYVMQEYGIEFVLKINASILCFGSLFLAVYGPDTRHSTV